MSAHPADIFAELGLVESPEPVSRWPGWRPPRKIVALIDSPDRLAWFQEVAPGVEIAGVTAPREAAGVAADADALLAVCTPGAVAASAKLKWVQLVSAGVSEYAAIPELTRGDILVTNMQRVFGPPIAEHVIALLFFLTRRLGDYAAAQRTRTWDQSGANLAAFLAAQQRHMEVHGKTMLIFGLGGIGAAVAVRARALGMRITAIRNTSREKPQCVDEIGGPGDLLPMASKADVVVNTAPLTPETTSLFNTAFFAVIKPGALFINVARGAQVVQDALIAALTCGTLGGAALDVTDPEPLPADHPLWTAPNLLITPHVSSYSAQRGERMWAVARENLRRYAVGDKMLSVVDLKRGY